jgi:carbonic anhydrase
VPPEMVFDAGIGDLFVVRSAGNLSDDHALGSIEYAVEQLGTKLIVVLGHERCGAVTAAMAGPDAPGHVGSIVRAIRPAVEAVGADAEDRLGEAIAGNARRVAAAIRSQGEFGGHGDHLVIVPAVYDLDSGAVTWLD